MGKAYTPVSNEARKELIRLISEEGLSIIRAAEATGIYYPTAKAINKVFKQESRVQKRTFRYRTKKDDEELGVVRNKIPIERLVVGTELSKEERLKVTCGIRVIAKKDRVRFLKKIPLITTFETGLLSTAKEEVISSEEPVGGPNNYYKPDLSAPNNLCNVDVRST